MFHHKKTEVLVVGAGPVGMLAALVLARQGVDVTIIDAGSRTVPNSYACVLHPGTLELFAEFGLDTELVKRGRRVGRIGFYDLMSLNGEIGLQKISKDFPFMLVLPQSSLEEVLEDALAAKYGVKIYWNHRLTTLKQQRSVVEAAVDKLGEIGGKGYAVADLDSMVEKTIHFTADFVIGADGHNSHVRDCLNIELSSMGKPKAFAMYEFATNFPLESEARIILSDENENALWPLPDGRCRWTFEVPSTHIEEFPQKNRSLIRVEDPFVDTERRRVVKDLLAFRALWFPGAVDEIVWSTEAQFEPLLAERFGENHCWLAGDAAHQTYPIGVQSMNVGLREGADLASRIARIVRGGSLDLLRTYESERRQEWKKLLGAGTELKPRPETSQWIADHRRQFLSCTPASGRELVQALDEIGLSVQ